MKLNFFYLLFISLFCLCSVGVAQTKEVRGVVTDEANVPIIGVNVKIQGNKTAGTITDLEGRFTLRVSADDVLEFSYIGYSTKKEIVAGRDVINVVLSEDSEILNEVIITGYGTMSKKNLTTSIAKVAPANITKTGISNVTQMLLGRAAGLKATIASSEPGGAINLSIRGGGTPLYVIDGVVVEPAALESSATTNRSASVSRGGLAGINPDDIESIEILKDASASIYGIGAADGVILITTKKGKEGRVSIGYDGNISLVANYPYYKPLDAKEYMKYVNIFNKELFLFNGKMGVYGPNPIDESYKEPYSQADIQNMTTNTDWLDLVMRNGFITTHNINIQGGSDKVNYYLSGNYYNQKGNVVNTDMERFILRSNISARIFKFLKLSNQINFNLNKNNNGSWGGSGDGGGAATGSALFTALLYPTNLPIYSESGDYTIFSTVPNPKEVEEISDYSESSGFSTNFVVDIDIIKNVLSGKLLYGYTRENSKRDVYIPSNVYFANLRQSRGSMKKDYRTKSTMEATLSYTDSFFSNNLKIDAVAGIGRYLTTWDGLGVEYTDVADAIGNDNIGAATGLHKGSSYRGANEKRSQFIKASIDLFDKYVISGTLRRDGTDKFFPDKKYSCFPSVSAAWKIFNESFMDRLEWINLLKLRASFGMTGRDNLGAILYGSYQPNGSNVYFLNDKNVAYYLSSLDYPNVTWEKNTMKNVGVDFSILKDRISGSFEYYWNDITDMLGYAETDGLSMFSSYPVNGGHIRRYGWEVLLETENVSNKNFNWSSVLTLSHNNAIWIERFPNYVWNVYQQKHNEPVNMIYFYRVDGIVNSDMSNVPSSQPEAYRVPGFPIIKDLNQDGTIDYKDIDSDNNIPALYWGFGNTFKYKNWDLDIFMYSQLGVRKYVTSYNNGVTLGRMEGNQTTDIYDVWNSISNPNGKYPGIAYQLSSVALPENVGTDLRYENANFVRVRNITLGYNFTNLSFASTDFP